jgi:hypothetical protein
MGSIASAVGGVVGSVGGMISGNKAANAANQQADYLRNLSAEQQQRLIDASTTASQMGQFKPVTVTSQFGNANYTYGPKGRLLGASATAAPWLQELQTRQQALLPEYMDLTEGALNALPTYQQGFNLGSSAANRMYTLGNEALPTSYDVAGKTQEYYDRMQQMVAADRERQLAGTRQGLFNTGRAGLAIGATQAGGELATNPEMAAYYNAIARQDLDLANQAEQRARANLQEDISTGARLYAGGSGLFSDTGNLMNQMYRNVAASQTPFASGMLAVTGLEDTAYSPVERGFRYASPVTLAQQWAGNMLYQGAQGAANAATQFAPQIAGYQYQNSSYSPWGTLLSGMGQGIQTYGAQSQQADLAKELAKIKWGQ